jgi:PAS domain S-box-containing protein
MSPLDELNWDRLRPLLDDAGVVVFARDLEGRYLYVNRAFEKLVGRPAAEVLGRKVHDVLPPEAADAVLESDRLAISGRRGIAFETPGLYGSGRRNFMNFKFPLLDGAGAAHGVLGFGTDLTERRHREDALQAASLAVSSARGDRVFQELTRYLATILNVQLALVGRITGKQPDTIRTLGIYGGGAYRENFEYALAVTPCRTVVSGGFTVVPRDVVERFPEDEYLPKGAVGYAGYPLKDAAGQSIGVIAVISREPITDEKLVESVLKIFAVRAAAELERRAHEEALAASEANYRAIFEAVEDAIFIHDCDSGAILDVNPKACSTYGHTREELRRMSVGELSGNEHPFTDEEAARLIGEVRAGRGPLRFEWRRRNKDGTRHWDEVTLKKVDIAGKPHILAMTRQITERKSTVEALRASEEQYRAIFNASADSLVLRDADFRVVDVNPAYEAMSGRRREEALGRSDLTMSPPELNQHVKQLHARALAGERVQFEALARRKDGSRFSIETRGVPILHKGEAHVLYIGRDITARKTEEELLRASEEQYRAIFDASEDALVLWNSELERVDVNPAYERIYGFSREEVLEGTYRENAPPGYAERRRDLVRRTLAGERCHVELESLRKDGSRIQVELRTIPIRHRGKPHVLAIASDVTQRKAAEAERAQLEAQLRQAQKMEAIGQLSGGIAHDFNNILQSILGNLTLAGERIEALGDAKLARYLERAQISAQRARELIQQMLTFSRGRRGEPRPLALPQLVGEAAKLLRPTLPSSIELATEVAADVPAVRADPVQLEQVLLNLCINARDAMGGVGDIAVAVREVRHAGTVCTACRQKFSGAFVELSVRDTGPGIAEAVVDRMFEPFFSTKDVGKGSGMGLSMVHGIVHEHGGHVVVDTAPGLGASFRVALPAASGDSAALSTPLAREKEQRRLAGSVLVVDDEPMVLELMGELLSGWGLEVTVKSNAVEARHAFAAEPQRYDAVLTDHTMPRLTGLELARHIHGIRPATPVILYTGYGEDIPERELAAAGVRALARKPVDAAELFALLKTSLKQTHNTLK